MIAILPLGDDYQLLALLHIAAAVAAFGPVLMFPALHRAGETTTMARVFMRTTFPALTLLWVLGMGLAGMSDGAYKMSQTWLAFSLANWAILMAVAWFFIRPAITDTSDGARRRLAIGSGIFHVGLVVGLALMIWKPGL